MTPAALAESFYERFGGAGEENYFSLDALGMELIENSAERFKLFGKVAGVDAHSNLVKTDVWQVQFRGQCTEQAGRKVIDAVVPEILQGVQGNTLPRAG